MCGMGIPLTGEESDQLAAPIYAEATVAPDGQIHVAVPGLAPGQRVRVSIEPEEAEAQVESGHVIDIVEHLPGHRLFKTAEEVDAYINEERASWDR
jgi:hypothetical protein